MCAAGIEPELIITVDVRGRQAAMNLVQRKGQNYQ